MASIAGEIDYEAASESTHDTEEDLSAQDLVDFSPVYRCLHIHTVLQEREEFEKYYRKQRSQQANLALKPPVNMHESIEGYRGYFHGKDNVDMNWARKTQTSDIDLALYFSSSTFSKNVRIKARTTVYYYLVCTFLLLLGIVGFFVCEDHVLNTSNGLVTRGYLDEVWSTASSKIISTLQTHSAYCTEAGFMLKIKNLMLLFASTLQVGASFIGKLLLKMQFLAR